MKFDIKVYGVHKRDDMIKTTVERLGLNFETDVFYDDREKGGDALYTAKKAWLSPIEEDITHRVCLPDDVYVCDNFREVIQNIIEQHPNSAISLFPFLIREKNSYISGIKNTAYVKASFLAGIGIILPVNHIKPCFDYIHDFLHDQIYDDTGMSWYCDKEKLEMLQTIPSTLQHIGDETLIWDKDTPIRRTDYFKEHINNIDNFKTTLIAVPEYKTVKFINPKNNLWDCKRVISGIHYEEGLK